MKINPEKDVIGKSIELYKNILINDKSLVLHISDDKYRYVTKLIELKNNQIIFEAPIHKLDWVIFPIDTNLDICFISKLCIFNAQIKRVEKYKQRNTLLYVGTIISPIIKKQQRQSFRLDTIINVTYSVMDSDIYNSSPITLPEDLVFKKAICINISLGGMCFHSSEKENSSHIVLVNFNFMDTDFHLYGEILEMGLKNNAGNYQHRIKFIDMDTATINSLNKSIYKKQQHLLKSIKL